MEQFDCNVKATNTGQACTGVFNVQNKIAFFRRYGSDGTLNEIDLTVPLDETFWTNWINAEDPRDRLLPLYEMENVSDMRATPEFKTWDSGNKSYITQGIREFSGIMLGPKGSAPQLEGKINANRGNDLVMIAFDRQGNVLGKRGTDSTKLAGVQIASQSLYAILQKTQDKDVRQIMIGFDFANTEQDGNLWMIKASDIPFDVNSLEGLINVTGEFSSPTTTTLTVKLVTDGGDAMSPVLVLGLTAPDFVSSDSAATSKIYNATDDSDVSITVVESPPGTYTLTFVAQTAGDDLVVKPLKAGFDFTAVEADVQDAL